MRQWLIFKIGYVCQIPQEGGGWAYLANSLIAKDPRFLHADSEDSDDQTGRWTHTHFVGFDMLIFIISSSMD